MRLLVSAGVILLGWQYIAGGSLWIDEIALARNVFEHSWFELLTLPLMYGQTAPKGFLAMEKLVSLILGSGDYALRLLPLACALLALFVAWRVLPRLLGDAGPAAVALFALSVPLIQYGAQVKPYAGDVAVAMVVLWLAFDLGSRPVTRGRMWWTGAAGAVAVWFSYPAVLMLAGTGAAVIFVAWREGGARRAWALWPTIVLWSAGSAGAVLSARASTPAALGEYLRRYWASGMAPTTVADAVWTSWPLNQLAELFGSDTLVSFGYPAPFVYMALAGLGAIVLLRQRVFVALLLLLPIVVTLAAAVARQYPFSDRLILFLVPSLFAFVAAGAAGVARALVPHARSGVRAAIAGLVLLPALLAIVRWPPPYAMEDAAPVLSYVHSHRAPGDRAYVYYGAAPAVWFYGPRFGFNDSTQDIGGCHRGDSRKYFDEIDRYRGEARLWVVITHALPIYAERDDIVSYLDAIGVRRASIAAPPTAPEGQPAEALLYDLSDPVRLRAAAAADFPVTGPEAINPRHRCAEGPLTMGRYSGMERRQ